MKHSWPNENNFVNSLYMKITSKKHKHLPGITVDPNMPDLSKDPFVLKKVERARAFLAKHPIPEDMLKKSERK
jgi:hypothetical protein